jgi:hypothetical protein
MYVLRVSGRGAHLTVHAVARKKIT